MAALIEQGWLDGGDGLFDPETSERDRLSGPGYDVEYRLTAAGRSGLEDLGIDVDAMPGRRRLIRYCVDWSEQRHHLSGKLGAALFEWMLALDWLRRAPSHRGLTVTDRGHEGLGHSPSGCPPAPGRRFLAAQPRQAKRSRAASLSSASSRPIQSETTTSPRTRSG